jgi:hypothetical protein
MHWTRQELDDPLDKLTRALQHGKRWCQVYWEQTFSHEGVSINAASVPTYLVQAIEREETRIEDVVCSLARASSREKTNDPYAVFGIYNALWDEAVTYVLGVRQDILRASSAGDAALIAVEDDRWMDAFKAACVAYDIEVEHAGDAKYWHPFLYNISDVLIRLGHARSYTDLRRLAQTPTRDKNPRSMGSGWKQRKGNTPTRRG